MGEPESRVFIATAGWSVPRAHASSVPPAGTGLQRYSAVFNALEINSTFYRRHQLKTFERWQASVPQNFRFAVKVPRWITHETALASPAEALAQFFDDVGGLGEKLGPILVQLPASVGFNVRRARAFFRVLRARYSGPVACEPRSPEWYADAATRTLVDYDIARVVADPPRPAEAKNPGGSSSLRYTRWHGSPHVYYSSYSDEQLLALAESTLEAPAGTQVWCIFDNTASGSAFGDALRFRALLAKREKQTAFASGG